MIKMAYASQAGTLHRLSGIPCQDQVAGRTEKGYACVALADGAGSVPCSEKAAEVVVNVVVAELSNHFSSWYEMSNQEFAFKIVELCQTAVAGADEALRADCTLLAAAVSTDGRRMICHIGDGSIFGISAQGETQILSKSENGEEPNQTYFLSGQTAEKHIRRCRSISEQWNTFLLCSDGVSNSLWNEAEEACAPAVKIMAGWMDIGEGEDVSLFLSEQLDEVFRRNTRDDMSIAILSFAP